MKPEVLSDAELALAQGFESNIVSAFKESNQEKNNELESWSTFRVMLNYWRWVRKGNKRKTSNFFCNSYDSWSARYFCNANIFGEELERRSLHHVRRYIVTNVCLEQLSEIVQAFWTEIEAARDKNLERLNEEAK